jgi:hypothetical protein
MRLLLLEFFQLHREVEEEKVCRVELNERMLEHKRQ